MALVDYSSGSEAEAEERQSDPREASKDDRAKKRQRPNDDDTTSSSEDAPRKPPPLPAAFHDLYASTVRPSVGDDPNLHQGRRRQIPHVAGNWPSHLYVEWHPSTAEHASLTKLLSHLEAVAHPSTLSSASSPTEELHTLLTSDLGAPMPLHISLSRPLVLSTSERDVFLRRLEAEIRGCGVAPFELSTGVATTSPVTRRFSKRLRLEIEPKFDDNTCPVSWHRGGPDSGRSFLVLQVRGTASTGSVGGSTGEETGARGRTNPELVRLLERCNTVVSSFGRPTLYQGATAAAIREEDGGDEGGEVDDAFHVSIAWAFAGPTAELRRQTAEVFNSQEREIRAELAGIRIPVDSIKAKIGNVVTNIALPEVGKAGGKGSTSIFGA